MPLVFRGEVLQGVLYHLAVIPLDKLVVRLAPTHESPVVMRERQMAAAPIRGYAPIFLPFAIGVPIIAWSDLF